MLKKCWILFLCACFLVGIVPQANASEATSAPKLTLNQAIERAINESEEVESAELEIKRTKALKEEASDQLNFIPVGGKGYNPQIEAKWANMLKADLTWQMKKKEKNAKVDGLALDVCKAYWDILNLKEKVNVKKIETKKAKIELRIIKAKYDVGLVTKVGRVGSTGLEQAKAALKKAESELKSAKNDLANAYKKFNKLVGLPLEKRPVLTDELKFNPLEINSIDAEINHALNRSPSVWMAEQNVNLQKHYHDLLWATGEYRPYDAREAEVEKAEIDVISAKEATKLLVHEFYYKTKNVEEGYKAAKEGVRVAEEGLRVTKAMYDVGFITKAEVIQAKLKLHEARLNLDKLKSQHAYLKLCFQKPWAPRYSVIG